MIGCVFFLALALGGAHPETNLIAALFMCLVTAVLFSLAANHSRLTVGPPFFVVALAAVATLFQLTPLPSFIVSALSPATAYLHGSAVESPSWLVPMTLDAPATSHEELKLIVLLMGALVALELFIRRPRDLFGGVALAGAAVFVVGLLHQLAGWKTAYGIMDSAPPFPTSFINPNHAAAFMGFAAFLSLGLALTVRDRSRIGWAGASVLCAAGVVLTLSRGGILAFFGALAVCLLLLFLRERLSGRSLLTAQLVAAGALVVASYLAYAEIVHELWTLGDPDAVSKTFILQAVPSLLSDYGVFGVGRGAMGFVYPAHQDRLGSKTFTHLENEWVQPLVDWGVLLGTVMVALAVWSMVVAFRRLGDDPLRIAGLSGLLFLAVHNLADFNLAVTGVSLPAVLVATVVVANPHRSRRRHAGSSKRFMRLPRRAAVLVAGACAVLASGLGYPAIAHQAERDTLALRQLAGEDLATFMDHAETIVARHPADFVLPLMVGARVLQDPEGASSALAWINRSMVRAHLEPSPHRLAGQALWRLGFAGQSMLEFRLADESGAPRYVVVAEVVGLTKDPQWLNRYVGESTERRLAVAQTLLRAQELERALAMVNVAELEENPERHEIAARVARAKRDYEAMLSSAERLREIAPRSSTGYHLHAEALLALGRVSEATTVLARGLEVVGPAAELMRLQTHALVRAGSYTEAREVAKKLLARTARPAEAGRAHALLGQIYQTEGQTQRALREYERARDRIPEDVGVRFAIAQLRDRIGDYRGALDELQRIDSMKPDLPRTADLRRAIEARQAEAEASRDARKLEALLKEGAVGPTPR